MEELAESITQYGVLVPGIVRLRESGGYELVAGHRRKRACELAGLEKMPVIIKDLTDDEATVIMVDSNIQREELLISEKAFAYKMKYEALKRQGKRSDLTSCQVGKKLAAEEVSQNTGDSSRQILRYIHLTELVAELLELADEKKLPFNTAVELSYFRTEEQQILFQYMSNHNMVPSMKQAKELKQISKERMLTYSEIDQICMNESTEKVQVQIPAKKLKQYFPDTYTKTQMEEIIFMLLASWAEREGKIDIGSGNGGIISQLKMQNEMKLTDESWISYQQGKGNEEYQKYMEDLTDMQNHVLPYLQSFCSLEEKGVKEKREQQVAEKNESREAVPRSGVDENTGVKDAGKAERKAVAQKKAMPGKEKKPSIHERLEINKRIIQEKQGKDKPERGADLGVR